MHFIDLNATTLHFKKTSSDTAAPALVLINSLGTDFRIWDEFLLHLGHQGEVLTYDKRGHGLSGVGDARFSIDLHMRDLAALMDSQGIKNAVICGVSVGGMIAMALQAARPDLVRGSSCVIPHHALVTLRGGRTASTRLRPTGWRGSPMR
nr:alpha/beta fold hydrolase [Pseudovibrio denitrificans]